MNKKVKLLYVDHSRGVQLKSQCGQDPKDQNVMCLPIKRVHLSRKKKLKAQNFGLGGQIKRFRGSHLARGPHAVHACYRWFYEQITMVNYKRSQNTKYQ